MSEYEKECAMLCLKVTKAIKNAILDDKYFYNTSIFRGKNELISEHAKKYIYETISKEFPNYRIPFRVLSQYNRDIYDEMSFINLVKRIGLKTTMGCYKEKFKEEGQINLDLDVKNFNISKKSIYLLQEKIPTEDNVIRLKDVLFIGKQEVLNWSNENRLNKKDVLELVDFCSYLISSDLFIKNNDYSEMYEKETALKKQELLNKLSSFDDKCIQVENEIKTLESYKQELLLHINNLEKEFLELHEKENQIEDKKRARK